MLRATSVIITDTDNDQLKLKMFSVFVQKHEEMVS